MKVTLINCGPIANDSEQKAIDRLKAGLISIPGADEWLLLANLMFFSTHRRQSDEIDLVAIGPPGIRVIEVKHWTAAWVKRNAELVEREADRVTNKARKVGTTLRRKIADLDRVDGVFLVTQDASKVKPLEGREIRGVRFHTLKTWRDALAVNEPASLSPSQVKMLGNALYPKARVSVDGDLRRLAGYVNLEKLRDALSALLGEPPEVVAPQARFWTEDQVVSFRGRDYRIVSRLGSGGVGTAFKVVRIDGATV